jgi:hypothetical protein
MVVRFSIMGRKGRWPLDDAFQGRKVSWGKGVTARCRLFSVRVVEGSRVFSAAGTGVASACAGAAAVDSGAAGGAVAAGAVVEAGAGGAVAAPPQARTNNRNNATRVTVDSLGFRNRWYIMAGPPSFLLGTISSGVS